MKQRTIDIFCAICVIVAMAILMAVLVSTAGCAINVDKSVHLNTCIAADRLARVEMSTSTENLSDTKADGNSASGEADLAIPLLP